MNNLIKHNNLCEVIMPIITQYNCVIMGNSVIL